MTLKIHFVENIPYTYAPIYFQSIFTCLLVRGKRATLWPFKSNKRICLLSCGIAIIPMLDTASRFTEESVRIVVKAERIFRNSHTFTVRSSDPDTTLSSLVKTVDVTLL